MRLRSHTATGRQLIEDWEYYKAVNPIKLARAKLIAKTIDRIFFDLVKATQ
jgi:hypothetical protein